MCEEDERLYGCRFVYVYSILGRTKSIVGRDAEFDKNKMDHHRMVKDWAFHRAVPL